MVSPPCIGVQEYSGQDDSQKSHIPESFPVKDQES